MKKGILTILILLLAAGMVLAQAPNYITYQGRLTDDEGDPITSSVSVTFAIYAASTGGTALFTSTQSVDPDDNGVFTVQLGPLTTSHLDGSTRYLGIKVGTDAEMTPRQAINSAPYSITTATVPNNSVTSAKITDGSIVDADINASAAIAASKINGVAGLDYSDIGTVLGITTTITSLGSVTLSCPTSGYVLVIVSGSAVMFGDATVLDVGMGTSESAFLHYYSTGYLDGSRTDRSYNPFCVTYVTSVAAGSRTFYALARKNTAYDTNTINLTNVYLTAIFFPRAY
nr:hypothetical protein [candidate division Zixibacteria bacterium]